MNSFDERIRTIVDNAPFPIALYTGPEMRIDMANQSMLDVWGKGNDVIGKSYKDVLPELEGQSVFDKIDRVFQTGEPFHARNERVDLVVNGRRKTFYFNYSFTPMFDNSGQVYGIMNTAADVTDAAESRLRAEQSEATLYNMILQAPVAMCIMLGPDHVVEIANELMIELWGKPADSVLGKPVFDALPDARGQGLEYLLNNVYQTGETFKATEMPVSLVRHGVKETVYQTFVYQPYRLAGGSIAGVIAVTTDVSEQVSARKLLEDSYQEQQEVNEELAASNEELAAVNEELAAVNEELNEAQERIAKSEKLFRSIAVNIPNSLVIVIDKDHRYVIVEGDLMKKLGFNGKDYEGKHPAEVGPPDRYESVRPLYDRMLAGEQFSDERKGANGGDFMVHFVPLKDEEGEVYSGLVIAIDITEMKMAEERSGKLAAIVLTSDDAIVSKTLEGVVTSWNHSAERIFGYTADEMIGQSILKIIPEDRHHEEPQILARIRRGERIEHFETIRRTKSGQLLDISVTISPVTDAQGTIIGISKIARDITERKLEEMRKNDFIGMVSHELKTPLTSLTALVQVAHSKMKGNADPFISGALEKAGLQVKKMAGMINGFLNVSRLESGKMTVDKREFNLPELIREIINETELTALTHRIRLHACENVTVYADHDKIGSVISNLLSNAIKYSAPNTTVEVSCDITADEVTVNVKDQGIGIDPANQHRLFERYFRVQADNTDHISGFGIGLYLSAEIVHRHEGRIWVESEVGVGSTFRFALPLRKS